MFRKSSSDLENLYRTSLNIDDPRVFEHYREILSWLGVSIIAYFSFETLGVLIDIGINDPRMEKAIYEHINRGFTNSALITLIATSLGVWVYFNENPSENAELYSEIYPSPEDVQLAISEITQEGIQEF